MVSTQTVPVIWVVSQFVPFAETRVNVTHRYQNLTISNSGYTVAVPMDPGLELINSPYCELLKTKKASHRRLMGIAEFGAVSPSYWFAIIY